MSIPTFAVKVDLQDTVQSFKINTYAGSTPTLRVFTYTNLKQWIPPTDYTIEFGYGEDFEDSIPMVIVDGNAPDGTNNYFDIDFSASDIPQNGEFWCQILIKNADNSERWVFGDGSIRVFKSPLTGSPSPLNLLETVNWDTITNIGDTPWSDADIDKFIELTDTPNSYTGNQTKILAVNNAEDALEFIEQPNPSTSWGSITGTITEQTDLIDELDTKANVNGQVFTGEITATNLSGTNTGDQDLSGIEDNLSEIESNVASNTANILINASNIASNATDISLKADKTNVLELDNTDVFEPDQDYEPATKKYVDDNSPELSDYAKLDGSNQPFTGDIEINKSEPKITLTEITNNNSAEITKYNVNNNIEYTNTVMEMKDVYALNCPNYASASIYAYHYMTISMWIYPTSSRTRTIIGVQGGPHFQIQQRDTGQVRVYSQVPWSHIDSDVTLNINQWNYVAGYFDPTQMGVYVNGVLKTKTQSTNYTTANGTCWIGHWHGGSKFYGRIEETGIWYRVRTASELDELYNNGNGIELSISKTFVSTSVGMEVSNAAMWHFDEGSGNTSVDSGNSGHNVSCANNWAVGKTFDINYLNPIYLQNYDSGSSDYNSITELGDSESKTIIESKSTRFNNNGVEKFAIDDSGDLVLPDNYKINFGDGKDAGIEYDGTKLNIESDTTIKLNAGIIKKINKQTASYTILATDYTVIMNGTSLTATLPSATTNSGQIFFIKNINSSSLTLQANGTETIDGATTQTLTQYTTLQVQSDGASWFIL